MESHVLEEGQLRITETAVFELTNECLQTKQSSTGPNLPPGLICQVFHLSCAETPTCASLEDWGNQYKISFPIPQRNTSEE